MNIKIETGVRKNLPCPHKCYRSYNGTDTELRRDVHPHRQFDSSLSHHVLPLRQSKQVGTGTEVEERSKSSSSRRDCIGLVKH